MSRQRNWKRIRALEQIRRELLKQNVLLAQECKRLNCELESLSRPPWGRPIKRRRWKKTRGGRARKPSSGRTGKVKPGSSASPCTGTCPTLGSSAPAGS